MNNTKHASHIVGERLSKTARQAAKVLRKGADELDSFRKTYKACSRDKVAGRCAEVHHKITRNFDAAKKGIRLKSRLTKPGSVADLKTGARYAQVKYCKTAAWSAGRASHPKYKGMDLVLPSDQAKLAIIKLKQGAKKIAKKNAVKSANRLNASKRIKSIINVGGAQSRPLSRKAARSLARNGGKAWRREAKIFEGTKIAASHFTSGAIGSGLATGVEEIYGVLKNKKCAKKASLRVAKIAAMGGAESLVNRLAVAGVKTVAKNVGTKALAKGDGAVVIATSAIDIAKLGFSYANGDIKREEFLIQTGKSILVGAVTGLGYAVAGPIGGTVASLAVGYGFDQLV